MLHKGRLYNEVELFGEPLNILHEIPDGLHLSEMTTFDISFLCGLIKQHRPRKIVEVGIAAGATTSVVLNALSILDIDAKMISIDISERYYRDFSKKTGFVADEAKSYIERIIDHQVLLGKAVPECIEDIGGNIDFLILDTVHSLPGELLDFIALYPHMKKGGVVVLHDVNVCHIAGTSNDYATKLLFAVVTGNKYWMMEDETTGKAPNIAAFVLGDETEEHLKDVFYSLSLTWQYCPSRTVFQKYRECISNQYSYDLLALFELAYEMQIITVEQDSIPFKQLVLLNCKRKQHIIIYGSGAYGRACYRMLKANHVKVDNIVISDNHEAKEFDREFFDVPIIHFSETKHDPDECMVVVAMNPRNSRVVINQLMEKGWHNVTLYQRTDLMESMT